MIFTILLTLWNSEQKNWLLIKHFSFLSDFDETWWSCSYPWCVVQFNEVSSKSDEKQKSLINSPFFCSEFQIVSRIVKIVHSVFGLRVGVLTQHGFHKQKLFHHRPCMWTIFLKYFFLFIFHFFVSFVINAIMHGSSWCNMKILNEISDTRSDYL